MEKKDLKHLSRSELVDVICEMKKDTTNSNDLKEIMTKTVKFCHADDSIESTARRMRKLDISCLPVVDDDFKLKGIISTDQISHLVSEYR